MPQMDSHMHHMIHRNKYRLVPGTTLLHEADADNHKLIEKRGDENTNESARWIHLYSQSGKYTTI